MAPCLVGWPRTRGRRLAYDAFISYSHSVDGELATAVRDGLQKLAKPWNKRRALNVFLDQASLEASAGLKTSLVDKLDATGFLVLLASPDSAGSQWVDAEIEHWTASRQSADNVRLVLTDGDLVWDEAAGRFDPERSTSASPALSGLFSEEPLWLDLRWARDDPDLDIRTNPRWKSDVATLAAPMHGKSKEEIVGEDLDQFRRSRRLRRAAIAGLAVLTVAAVLAGIVAFLQRGEALRQRDDALAKSLANQSRLLAAERTDFALLLALESLRTADTVEGNGALLAGIVQPINLRLLTGHEDQVLGVAYSPDGSMLASASWDGSVRLWDAQTGQPLGEPLLGHDAEVSAVAFSPDGTVLASASWDTTVRLWDAATAEPLGMTLSGHRREVSAIAFSPDGAVLASAGWGGNIRLWDAATGDALGEPIVAHDDEIASIGYSPDGTLLASAGFDGTIRLWDIATRTQVGDGLAGHRGRVHDVAWSATGLLASAGADATVRVWDVATGGEVLGPLAHGEEVFGVAFAPDTPWLAAVSGDAVLRIWDMRTGNLATVPLQGHSVSGFDVVFSPTDSVIASAGFDGVVRLWRSGGLGETLRGHAGPATGVAFSGDGSLLASSSIDGTVVLWDPAARTRVGEPMLGHEVGEEAAFGPGVEGPVVNGVAFNADATILASAGADGTVRLWDPETSDALGPPLAAASPQTVVAFHPNRGLLASGDAAGTLRLWDAATGEQIGDPLDGHIGAVRGLAFSPDGATMASTGIDGTIRIRRTTDDPLGRIVPLPEDWQGTAITFSPDGAMLAVAMFDRVDRAAVSFWDPATGEQIGETIDSDGINVPGLVFSPDGTQLVAVGFTGTIEWWDVADPGNRAVGLAPSAQTAVAFSPDGTIVATAGVDGEVRLWPLPSEWAELACASAARNMSMEEWTETGNDAHSYVRHCPAFPAGTGAPTDAPAAEYPG